MVFLKTIRQSWPLFKMKLFSVGGILTLSLIVKYKYKTVSDVDKGVVALVPARMQ